MEEEISKKRIQRNKCREAEILKIKMGRDSRNIRECREIMSWKITKSG